MALDKAHDMKLSQSPSARTWSDQFRADQKPLAEELLDTMLLVSHDAFFDGLHDLVLERAETHDGKIGLYAEREIRKYKGVPNRLFKERLIRGSLRAFGSGPKPVQPTRTYNPDVGSEGLIAWAVTELCRQHREKFISHPGPEEICGEKICAFFLLTDFIGTGRQASAYLSAAWRIASVKSWHSGRFFRCEVISYSGTKAGVRRDSKASFRGRGEFSLYRARPCFRSSMERNLGPLRLCAWSTTH